MRGLVRLSGSRLALPSLPASSLAVELLAVNAIAALALRFSSSSSRGSGDASRSLLGSLRRLDPSVLAFAASFLLANVTPLLSVPSELLESLSWRYFLQGALALSLVGGSGSGSGGKYDALPILAAFAMGCTGSLLGGVLGYKAVSSFTARSTEMAICAASLMASYIGGTANFFETSSYLATVYSSPAIKVNSSIFAVVAGVDIAFMVAFFQLLTYIRNRHVSRGPLSSPADRAPAAVKLSARDRALYQFLPVTSAFAICRLSSLVQSRLVRINGVSVTVTTCLSIAVAAALGARQPLLRRSMIGSSSYLVVLFYSSIGLLLRAKDVQLAGAPIAALISTILLTHVAVMQLLRCVWNKALPARYHIDMETLIVASNACVGGSGTASQMASSFDRPDLCALGSIVGVLGYLVGTQAALRVSSLLIL